MPVGAEIRHYFIMGDAINFSDPGNYLLHSNTGRIFFIFCIPFLAPTQRGARGGVLPQQCLFADRK